MLAAAPFFEFIEFEIPIGDYHQLLIDLQLLLGHFVRLSLKLPAAPLQALLVAVVLVALLLTM